MDNYEFLRDVLLLLSLCVEHRARRVGLHGSGVTLKLTYSNMKGITRSSLTVPTESAVRIYREASRMLDQVDRRPVRLIGVSIYNLSGEEGRQLTFEDYFEDAAAQRDAELKDILDRLGQRYGLDFAGHLTQIMQMDTLHKTIEYMRSHS